MRQDIFSRKRFVFLPTGETIEKFFTKVQPKFSQKSIIVPCDERMTYDPNMKNFRTIRKMVGYHSSYSPLNRYTTQDPINSCVVLSVAKDFHFASIFPSKGDLNKKGNIIFTQSLESKTNRISLGISFLRLTNVLFLFSDDYRYSAFLNFIKNHHQLKAIFHYSQKVIF